MPELVLTPLAPVLTGDRLRQSCRIRRPDSPASSDSLLWWESPASLPPLRDGDAESYLIATLFTAMAEGRDVRVEGSIGPRLLANLESFTDAWSRWKPGVYRKIGIRAEAAPADEPAPWSPGAIAAFSGGVDATYTVWRHHAGLAGNGSRSIVACLLVQGFDIPLDQDEKFAASLDLARDTLDSVGIEVVPLRSNLREVFPTLDWHDLHGAAVVAASHLLKSKARTLLVGSSDPYDQLLLPYGSNPVTDPLLSSDTLDVVHDGCGTDRSGKVAAIGSWSLACTNLRVCWKGVQVGANCGRCEKCLRTRLNFLVNGLEPPASLVPEGGGFDFGLLDSDSESILQEYEQILDAARTARIEAPWVSDLAGRLGWLRRRNAMRSGARALKRLLRRFAGRSP